MASTTALFTGLSGLNANARNLDVIGNNIANANTTAFKSNRMLFASMFSRTFSIGSGPTDISGGTNPGQVGLGVMIAGTQRDFSGGALSATGDARDLAIEGDGFFIVRRGDAQMFSRAGAFRQNEANDLVTIDGDRVQGYAVDSNFNIVESALVDLNIPVGEMTVAEATRNVNFSGNLNAGGDLPTQGTRIAFEPMTLIGGPVGGPGGDLLQPTSLLTDIESATTPGVPRFTAGQTLRLTGAEKGNRQLPDSTLAITATTTVQDFMTFLSQSLGIDPTVGANPDGFTPGVTVNNASGVISIIGNTGTVNDLDIEFSDLRLFDSAGNAAGSPLQPHVTQQSTGESVRTTFIVYDSLGTPVTVDLSMVLDSRDSLGTTWRYFVESGDDSDASLQLETGTLEFDNFGQLTTLIPVSVQLDRVNSGALTPLAFDLQFASDSGALTSLTDDDSSVAAVYQDGSPIGTLASFAVGTSGVITGAFTNGLTRTIGQIALAVFSNPEGLVDSGSNLFSTGPNSGDPVITTPELLGAGRILGGSLELSNVDLSKEFINLILTSTGYSASSRVITTTDELMQQLLVLGR